MSKPQRSSARATTRKACPRTTSMSATRWTRSRELLPAGLRHSHRSRGYSPGLLRYSAGKLEHRKGCGNPVGACVRFLKSYSKDRRSILVMTFRRSGCLCHKICCPFRIHWLCPGTVSPLTLLTNSWSKSQGTILKVIPLLRISRRLTQKGRASEHSASPALRSLKT